LLQRFTAEDVDKILFSDEKLFIIQAVSNRQIDRILEPWITDVTDDMLIVPHSQHPLSVMVWAGMSANSRTNLAFAPEGVKMSSAMYGNLILDPSVKHAGQTMLASQVWTFQQDGVPAHSSNIYQAWLHREIPNVITKDQWPSSSPT
jgi:hypothetical protein